VVLEFGSKTLDSKFRKLMTVFSEQGIMAPLKVEIDIHCFKTSAGLGTCEPALYYSLGSFNTTLGSTLTP
jgi:hypothetical protein